MTMPPLRRLVLVLTVLFNSSLFVHCQNVTAEEIAMLSITGWYSDCDYDAETSCAGNYSSDYDPIPLDPTGNTCYVNPFVHPTSTTKNVVFWLGPSGGTENDANVSETSAGIYLYVLRVEDDSVDEFLPTNCTESGVCSCDSLETLRDPWRTTGDCSGGCSVTPADDLGLLDGDCAVLFKESVINPFFNGTIVTCSIQGTLVNTTTISPTTSPTASPTMDTTDDEEEEPTSSATTYRNAAWFRLTCSLALFAFLVTGL